MSEFKREERYIVIKLKDVDEDMLEELRGNLIGIRTRGCVVVEEDWPIYEQVWEMVRRLAEGRPQKVDDLTAHVERLTHLWVAIDDCEAESEEQQLAISAMSTAIQDAPSTSLARRDADVIESLRFPTMLRKMWSGGEVQQWLQDQADEKRRQAEGEQS